MQSPSKRLWILNHYAVSPRDPGGTRHYSLARAVIAAGGDASIFASGYEPSTGIGDRLGRGRAARTQILDGVPFVWLRTTPYSGNTIFRMLNMLSYAVMVTVAGAGRSRPDVVLGSTVHPFAALAGWLLARRHRARFVYEIRDLWPQTLVDLGAMRARSPLAKLLWAIESFLVRHSDMVVTLLPGVRSYLDGRGLPTHHVHYIPNGIDPGLARVASGTDGSPASPEIRLVEREQRDGRVVLAYVGAHGRVNALEVVLDAFASAQQRTTVEVALLMVGSGPEKPRLQAHAQELGLEHVHWLDPIPKSRVPGLLAAVDAGIVHATATPVYRYGISFNKLFDYMGACLPVIFGCSSINDPIAESGGGLSCLPDRPDDMAAVMIRMAESGPDARRAMGVAGREYVEEHHDLTKLGAAFAALLWPEVGAGSMADTRSPGEPGLG